MQADPRWLFALVDAGLVAVGPERQVEVGLEAPFERRRRLLDLIVDGAQPSSVARAAGTDAADAEALLDRLHEGGALVRSRGLVSEPPGMMLAEAIIAAARRETVGRCVWTAEELLVLPERAEPALVRRAVRAFVSGLPNDARLRAYSYVASWLEPTAWGDLPDARQAVEGRRTAERLDPGAVHVLDLEQGSVASAQCDRIGSFGARDPHRLGTVLAQSSRRLPSGLHHGMALHPVPNLRHPTEMDNRLGRGTSRVPERAHLIARAEAAERYAAGDAGRHELIRARGRELEGAVAMDEVYRLNDRQLRLMPELEPYDPDEAYLWMRATSRDGAPRWVPAEAVFFPFDDPERERPLACCTSSSGVAAHTDRGEAVERAFSELIERDGFMWHWVQRVSRERLDQRSLPTRHREQIAGIEAEGFDAHLVNLTLDIRPVILSVLLGRGWIITSAASASDPERAMAKSLAEGIAAAGIVSNAEPRTEPISAEEVRMPEHHIRLHRDASLIDRDRFLFSSPDTIRLDEIASPPESVADAVSTAGEPLTVELGSPATAPFHVVRALVPGIVPISFGFDQEPLGMPRLAEPKTTRDGRRLGRRLELEETGPLLPHPFA